MLDIRICFVCHVGVIIKKDYAIIAEYPLYIHSSSPEGHNMTSYLPPSTASTSRIPDEEEEYDPEEYNPEEAVRPPPMTAASSEPPVERPVSPALSSPEPEEEKAPPKRIIPPVVWKGTINMPEVARFASNGYHVSGPPHTLAMVGPDVFI